MATTITITATGYLTSWPNKDTKYC